MKNKYLVVFTLRQAPINYQVGCFDRMAKRSPWTTQLISKPESYNQCGIEVEASNEITAIHSAQFELKRSIGFNVSWFDSMPTHYGKHFLHEAGWDISVQKIGTALNKERHNEAG